jgi:hypothetical protein
MSGPVTHKKYSPPSTRRLIIVSYVFSAVWPLPLNGPHVVLTPVLSSPSLCICTFVYFWSFASRHAERSSNLFRIRVRPYIQSLIAMPIISLFMCEGTF